MIKFTTKTVRPTKTQANRVLALVCTKYGYKADDPYGPELRMDFDWCNSNGWPAIVWEGGPYEWAIDCSFSLLETCPSEIWLEPATGWALSIYREVSL